MVPLAIRLLRVSRNGRRHAAPHGKGRRRTCGHDRAMTRVVCGFAALFAGCQYVADIDKPALAVEGAPDPGEDASMALAAAFDQLVNELSTARQYYCRCYDTFGYESSDDCEFQQGGVIRVGRSECLFAALDLSPETSLPVTRCRRDVALAYRQCLTRNVVCSRASSALSCDMERQESYAGCGALTSQVDQLVDDCEVLWLDIQDSLQTQDKITDLRCAKCSESLGYNSSLACVREEGLGDGRSGCLENIYFSIDATPRTFIRDFLSCLASASDDYQRCLDDLPTCEDALDSCTLTYQMERQRCLTLGGLAVDPLPLCP